MKDPQIETKVAYLKETINRVNVMMKELQDLQVDVRISYIEKNASKEIDQGIAIWRIEETNSYL
jgi:hypothetical protein